MAGLQFERTRVREIRPSGEKLAGASFPRGVVDNRVAIGREARSIDGAPLEGQPVKHCGRRLAAARAEKKTHSRGEHDRQPNSYGQQEVPAACRRGNDGGGCAPVAGRSIPTAPLRAAARAESTSRFRRFKSARMSAAD